MHEASWPWVKWLRPSWSRKTFCQLADLSALISRPPVLSPLVSPCLVSSVIVTCRPCPKFFNLVASCLVTSLSPLVSSCPVSSCYLLLSPLVLCVLVLVFACRVLSCLVSAGLVSSCPVCSCLVSAGLVFSWALAQFGAELAPSCPKVGP